MPGCPRRILYSVLLVLSAATHPCSAQYWDGAASGPYVPGNTFVSNYDSPLVEPELLLHPRFTWDFLDGVFFRVDPIFSIMTAPRETTIGDPNTAYVYRHDAGGPVTTVPSLDTSWIDPKGDWGIRCEFGRVYPTGGWDVGILNVKQDQDFRLNGAVVVFADPQSLLVGYVDADADGIDDDRDNDNVYGGSGADTSAPPDGVIDAAAPPDVDDLFFFLPSFSRLDMTASTQLTGIEWMLFRSFPGGQEGAVLDYFFGARYLKVTDKFHVTGYGGVLDTSYWDTNVDNHIVGPQVGARWSIRRRITTLSLEARGLSGYNRQHVQQSGTFASNKTTTDRPSHLFPNSYTSATERDEFTPVTEWRAELLVECLPGLSFRMGYTGMYMGGISRAAPKVRYELPNLGLLDTDNEEPFFVNSFNLGVQGNF